MSGDLGSLVPSAAVALERAGWTHTYSGKVRDLWTNPDRPGELLLVASDRVSAFDHILSPDIPGNRVLGLDRDLQVLYQAARVFRHQSNL